MRIYGGKLNPDIKLKLWRVIVYGICLLAGLYLIKHG